jgi:hypothetical protein
LVWRIASALARRSVVTVEDAARVGSNLLAGMPGASSSVIGEA